MLYCVVLCCDALCCVVLCCVASSKKNRDCVVRFARGRQIVCPVWLPWLMFLTEEEEEEEEEANIH